MHQSHTGESDAVESPIVEIVEQIAAREAVDPTELTPPLASVIDPDALDRLFHSSSADTASNVGRVTFEYYGYEVTVHSDESVAIDAIPGDHSVSDETVQSI